MKMDDYPKDKVYIFKSQKGASIRRGTCFSISNRIVLTAKHTVEIDGEYSLFLSPDDFVSGAEVKLKLLAGYNNAQTDFVLLECVDHEFSSFIQAGVVDLEIDERIHVFGFPVEKNQIPAAFSSAVSSLTRNINTAKHSFEIAQVSTVSNYKGMSGSPVLFNGYVVGMLIVQQGSTTLHVLSISDIYTNFGVSYNNFRLQASVREEIEYIPPEHPDTPFEICIDCNKTVPNVKGVNIGFEYNEWRKSDLIEFTKDWLIDYSLTAQHKKAIGNRPAKQLAEAIKKYPIDDQNALGDLFLHMAIRQTHKTIPVINGVYHINGELLFSCSHIVINGGGIELWLGASSIKDTMNEAILSVIDNINNLISVNEIKTRFLVITSEIDEDWPFKDKLRKLANNQIPIESRVDKIILPIFIVNSSEIIKNYNKTDFLIKFREEIESCRTLLSSGYTNKIVQLIDVRVFLFPVDDIVSLYDDFKKEVLK
ncbi:Hachiman antiphage defense system protein HamA [Citrobacter europaeus]|uniref:Hachiman antiphage defense system protein HamA n=1 Tax=Citrobacter europaeus TaxID=1914243 RepID=UPI00397E4FD1